MFLVMDPSAEAEARASALRAAILEALGPGSQRQLASTAGIEPNALSRMLLGKQTIQLEHVVALARALDVSTRSLLTKAGYIDDDGLVDPDHLPVGGRRAIRAILREFDGVSDNGPDSSEGVH